MRASVVVPVGPRATDLPEQLRALAGQSADGGFELVLSCNGVAPQRVAADVARISWPEAVHVEIIDSSERPGPSYARNVGWRHASGDVILFCDADDVVDADWVAEMIAALEHASIVGGRLDHERLNPRALSSWGAVGSAGLAVKLGHLPFAGSCNLGVRSELLEVLGGFDEGLTASEDVDLCWRAQYAGYELRFADRAVVAYRRRGDLASLYAQARNDAANDPLLLARHRAHGVSWSLCEIARTGAGVAVAGVAAPFSRSRRMQLASRGGRLVGHLRAARRMRAR